MRRIVLLPFVTSVFLSAFLLFLVQPLVTQLLLPLFGGSPAVWNTALVFFQAVLLLGYLYAHALVRIRSWKLAVPIHLIVLGAPLYFLPPDLPDGFSAPDSAAPALIVLGVLAVVVGIPFFTLSTNSSLIQYWWARTGRPGSEDPYWLYSASNLGSLLALLSYPFLLAPNLNIGSQAFAWSYGYGLFLVITLGALVFVVGRDSVPMKGRRAGGPFGSGGKLDRSAAATEPANTAPVPWQRVGLWVARAAVASSLLLSITMRISQDVGSVPLFWVIPLAVYLLTFILAFSSPDRWKGTFVEGGTLVSLSLSLGLLLFPESFSFGLTVLVALLTLFFGGLLCHGELARDRPSADRLTLFYLWISVGGVLGGVLNSLLAPLVFDSVAEYPLTLTALALLFYVRPGARFGLGPYRPSKKLGWAAAVALFMPLFARFGASMPLWGLALTLLCAVLVGIGLARYVGSVVAVCLMVSFLYFGGQQGNGHIIAQKRSFFGVVRVIAEGDLRTMRHGTTVHGMQNLSPALRRIPLTYFHPSGPMGSVVAGLDPGGRVGVVGLGTGALAALVDPGQEIVFHEIDPLVVELAKEDFTYLQDSRGSVRVVLGDGRQTLMRVPDGYYNLLILDAYSSDFVPVHLLTTEALSLYLKKTAQNGLILLHISHRHLDLARVVKGLVAALNLPAMIVEHEPSADAEAEGAAGSRVVAVAREAVTLDALKSSTPGLSWAPFGADVDPVVWTDGKTSLVRVLW